MNFARRLANRCIVGSASDVKEAALDLASEIAQNAPLALVAAKRVLNEACHGGEPKFQKDMEFASKLRFPLNHSEDFQESLKAFEEKRKPRFTGR